MGGLAKILISKIYFSLIARGKRHMRNYWPFFRMYKRNSSRIIVVDQYEFEETSPSFADNEAFLIIGSGHSAKQIHKKIFKGKTSVFVNGSILLSLDLEVAPDIYIALDPNFISSRVDIIDLALQSGAECFFTPAGALELSRTSAYFQENQSKVHIVDNFYEQYGIPIKKKFKLIGSELAPAAKKTCKNKRPVIFSHDVERGIFMGGTTAFAALQLIMKWKPKAIYLAGIDFTYKTTPRFYEEDSPQGVHYDREYEDIILPSFELASAELKKMGVKFYNLSQISRLPAILFD
jgi:Kdo-III transferase WaaZ